MIVTIMDKDGFDEITRNIPKGDKSLDVFLHNPGGSAEATESIVELLRARFSNIHFIVPNIAKSAATMMAMSGDQILMDERSELGPIDPQLIISRDNQLSFNLETGQPKPVAKRHYSGKSGDRPQQCQKQGQAPGQACGSGWANRKS